MLNIVLTQNIQTQSYYVKLIIAC